MACLPHLLPGCDEQRLVIRHASLLARQLQVGLGLAVQVAFQDFSGDLRGHDLTSNSVAKPPCSTYQTCEGPCPGNCLHRRSHNPIPTFCPKGGISIPHHDVECRCKATYRTIPSNVPSIVLIASSGILIPNSSSIS